MRPLQPELTMFENLYSYVSIFVRSTKASFAYRSTTVTNVITATFIYAVPLLVWRQVYAQNPQAITVSQAQMFPYLLLACCVNYSLSMGVEFRIGQRIRMGLIATDLLKPVDFQVSQGAQCIGDAVFNTMLGTVVFFCGLLLLGHTVLPADLGSFALFLVSFALAFLIMYNVCFVFSLVAFYTNSGYGAVTARMALTQAFSGMAAPLSLYPPFLKTIGQWLPFQHTIYTPVSIYMGWVKDGQALDLLLQQAAWVAGLFLLGKIVMNNALKQLEVQGG